MNDPSIRNPAYLPLTDQQLSEIDELCDRFDQELVNGDGPRIETFLADAPDAAQDGLLAELLAMEVEYRTKQGDDPERDDYVQRFPQQEGVVAGIFAREGTTQFPGNGTISIPVNFPTVQGNFRLIKQIGRGGMGIVWLAEQVQPVKRRVALKLIKSELTSRDVIVRFDAEKQALAMMDHPNIARVLDAGTTDDDRPYFVMELVDGIPITQYCDDNKLSVDERLQLFVPVCKAVQHAHHKGIIHRDLKPSNVLVTVIDGEAVPKVIDFGLAKAVEQNLQLSEVTMQTEFGKVVGTVQYMSPEQAKLKGANAEDADTRTDVYSLGVMLYELLTGSTPLDQDILGRNALLKVLELIREEDPPRPSNRLSSSSNEVNSEVSDLRRMHPARLQQLLRGELDWVVMKALEKNPARRYQTAEDLAQDLTNYLTGETVRARPPSTWYHVQKFASRNRGLVAAMFAIGVALLAGIAGTSYGLIRANQKTQLAEDKTLEANEQRGNAVEAEARATADSRRARDSEAAAKFQLAIARWDGNRAGDARELLHQIPLEYRDNFEWHYCSRRFQGSDITCYGHTSDVNEVAFTPDGTQVVSASGDGKIKLWDATTGKELATLDGDQGGMLALAINADGTRLASAGPDKTIWLWDTESGEVFRTLSGHTAAISCVTFSPTGDRIASASYDKTVKLWDAGSGEEIIAITGHTAEVLGVAFSPDGKRLASVGGDRLIRIWDARSGERITELSKHRLWIESVSFSADGSRLIASSYRYASLWDAQTWQFIAETGTHDRMVGCVAFSPDGSRFATGGEDTNIKLWDTRSGLIIKTLSGHAKSVQAIAFSPDGARLVSGSGDRTVKLWDARDGNELTLRGPTGGASVVFSAEGKQLASGADHGILFLRDAQTGEVQFTLHGHQGEVNGLSYSPDGSRIASAGEDHIIRLWNTQTGEEVGVMKGHTRWIRWVAFSPDGTQLASASLDGTAKLWDVNSRKETATLKGHRGGVYCVAFSPDGSRLATASIDRTVKLWDVRTGREIRTFRGHTGRLWTVAFDPGGKRLASGGHDTKVRLWDVVSGRQLATANIRSGVVWGIAFSPDGKRIAIAGSDSAIELCDALSGQEIMPLVAGSNGVPFVSFSHDGARFGTCNHDGNVRIFDAPRKHEITFLYGHTDTVGRVTFSADGTRIYSESENEKLVWDAATRATIPDAKWKPPESTTHTSPDRRWFVTTESSSVVLVDLEYKNTPDEKAYRKAKARFDPFWHQEQATAATTAQNWYAATFQFALLMKNEPDRASYYDSLQSSFQELESQFEQQERDLEPHLAMVVKESLKLPRGSELLNTSFEEPEIRRGRFEFRETIPGWKTTGKMFEIWSTGFLGVKAHDGNQFVELNAKENAPLYRDSIGIERGAEIEFSFAHRGRNGDDTLKLTITDLGADNAGGGGDDKELFSKEYTTGTSAWAVYDSTTEPTITALGNKVRFAYSAVYATGGRGPANTEGNFLDSAVFGVGVVSAK